MPTHGRNTWDLSLFYDYNRKLAATGWDCLGQVFGDKAYEKFGKGFISMHFSDQHLGSHKKMLVFKFALPDAKNMADMTRLVALVPYYIDLVGRYKLSSHAHTKTDGARMKVAQEIYKELQNARQEALRLNGERR